MSENNNNAAEKAAADEKAKADVAAKKKAEEEAKKKADAAAKKKADADAKKIADADAAAEKSTRVRVICEGTLGPKLLKKGDITDDPDYVAVLKIKGQKKVIEVK